LLLDALPGLADAVRPPGELPRDRSAVDPDVVLASQRWRLLHAAARTMAEHGYAATTIERITAAAGVSKKTFYVHFASKEAAFLACYDALGPVLELVVDSARGRPTLADTVEAMVTTYLGTLAAAPALTRLFLFEALTATPSIRARRAATLEQLADSVRDLLDDLRARGQDVPSPERPQLVAVLGGVNELCVLHLGRHDAESLPELAGPIEAFVRRVLGPTGS
jgi:AcrR family transcriptional regulator